MMWQDHSNCWKAVKPLIPPWDSDIPNGTPGKLGKTIIKISGHGKNSKDRLFTQRVNKKIGNQQRVFLLFINKKGAQRLTRLIGVFI